MEEQQIIENHNHNAGLGQVLAAGAGAFVGYQIGKQYEEKGYHLTVKKKVITGIKLYLIFIVVLMFILAIVLQLLQKPIGETRYPGTNQTTESIYSNK